MQISFSYYSSDTNLLNLSFYALYNYLKNFKFRTICLETCKIHYLLQYIITDFNHKNQYTESLKYSLKNKFLNCFREKNHHKYFILVRMS